MNSKISIAQRLNYSKFGLIDIPIYEVFEIIRNGDMMLDEPGSGSYFLKDITIAIRKEPDPKRQNEWKERYLPVAFFNGVWDGEKVNEYSNVTALDFDYIGTDEQLSQVMSTLKNTPFVMSVFRTFKPRRLKAIILHDNTDPGKHKEMYTQLIGYFGIASGIDTSCKDISRKSFLPWDEDIWINPYSQPYHFVPAAIPNLRQFLSPSSIIIGNQKSGKSKSPQSIVSILNSSWRKRHPEYWQSGNRATSIFKCACQFCEYGVPQDMAEDYFLTGGWIADDFTEAEVIKHLRGAYSCNKDRYGSKEFI